MTSLRLRAPNATDAARIWRIAPQFGADDHDSCYAFLLLCTHFADTGVVAEEGGEVLGFALGYRPPVYPDDVFVWQLGAVRDARGAGLTLRLLDELLTRPGAVGARFLCMTRAPEDTPLHDVLAGLARRRSARCVEVPCFPAGYFAEPHPDELLVRIGPLIGA